MLDDTPDTPDIPDIPEATRETIDAQSSSRSPLLYLAGGGVFLAAIAVLVFLLRPSQQIPSPTSESVVTPPTIEEPELATESTASDSGEIAEPEAEAVDNVLGHLPYEEVAESELSAVTADGRVRLRKAAAEKFQQMQGAARNQGIILSALSGFRSVEAQNYLFFNVKEQRVQDATT
ncbi:MAG: D-alanyl-D-alanine carboxypeptidase family protein, partial [Xenococcus sp. (in: cyanobacteria)]